MVRVSGVFDLLGFLFHHHHPDMLLRLRPTSAVSRFAFRRALSTRTPRGLQDILQQRPEDVVITYAKRTPIGRAWKGQFKETPVDELLNALFKAALAESKLDPSKIDDICVGTEYPLAACLRLSSLLLRNMSSSLASLYLEGGYTRSWYTSRGSYLNSEPTVLLWLDGNPQYCPPHPSGGNTDRDRCCR